MPFAVTWLDLEIVILSEVSQTKTNIIQCCLYVDSKDIVQMSLSSKHRIADVENKILVTKGYRGGSRVG